jgi:hypothetical protein
MTDILESTWLKYPATDFPHGHAGRCRGRDNVASPPARFLFMVTAHVKMGKPEPPGKNKYRVSRGKRGSKSTHGFVKTDICQFFR